MEKRLKIGEVVWAKIRGFPWWPAVIGKIEESNCANQEAKIKVHFIGDPSHAEVPISKIDKFEKKFDEFSKTKKRSLLNSITLAKKIHKGEIAFNNHLKEKENIIKKKPKSLEKKQEDNESEDEEDTSQIDKKLLRNKRKRKFSSSSEEIVFNTKKSTNLSNASEHRRSKYKLNNKSRRGSTKRCNIIDESSDNEDEKSSKSSCEENSELSGKINCSESSSQRSSCDTNEDLAEKLEQKIKDLVFFKIELPSATSNKSIISTIDDIEGIIREIRHNSLHEIVKDLMQFLICLTTNKNQNVSIKASTLSDIIKEKIVNDIFYHEQYCTKIDNNQSQINLSNSSLDIFSHTFSEEFYMIQEYSQKECEELHDLIIENLNTKNKLSQVNKEPMTPQKKKMRNFNIPKRRETKDSTIINGLIQSTFSSKNNNNNNTSIDKSREILNLKLDKSKEEESNLSEISLNSDKTDCEDKYLHKQKFIISPFAKSDVYGLLGEYFIEFNNEEEFLENFSNGCLFSCLDKNKNLKPVKNHYMRRRVCIKLFKVFERLLKKMNLENEIIKSLSIYLELKARDGDPDMSEKYRGFISAIFHKIKDKLITGYTSLTNYTEIEI